MSRSNRRRSRTAEEAARSGDDGSTVITHINQGELDCYRRRAMHASAVLLFFFAVLAARLWHLQIQQGADFARLAQNNRVRSVDIAAPRGNILDRKGREIVTNKPSFNLVWVRENNRVDEQLVKRVASILGVDTSELLARIRKMAGTPGHIPIRLAENLTWDKVAYIENNRMDMPGVKIEVVSYRVYNYGNLASHMIGYLGEISKEELKAADPDFYRSGDMVGKMGLERLREKDLHGEKGREYMEVNSLGFEQRYLKGVEPLPGNDLQLTIDVDLQQTAEQLMMEANYAGAAVAVEVNTGRILMIASSPVLDLSKFIGGISTKDWKEMLNNSRHPLINKTVQGQYPPASTYKIVTALAALAEGVVKPETTVYCPGSYRFGNRSYRCWKYRGGHGTVNLKRAMSESCDVYFYHVGKQLGVDRLASYARDLGLGLKTGVEIEHEKAGLIPTADWKMQRYGKPWQDGETLSIAIGQGFNLVTPLQLTMMTAAVANGGKLYKPGIIEMVRDPDGHVIEQFQVKELGHFIGQERNLQLIKESLVEVVHGKRGTGRKAQVPGITVAGKTGTAQVVRLKQYKHLKEEDIPYKYRDHAWFTAFAPAEKPEIAVTVLVEHGLHGGSAAAPIVQAVLQRYFADRLPLQEEAGGTAKPGAAPAAGD